MIDNPLRKLYDAFTHRWFLSTIFYTLSSSWFICLAIFGKELNLINATTNKITQPSITISIILVAVSFIFTISKTLADKKNEKGKEDGQYVLQELLESVNSCKNTKLRRFNKFIFESDSSDNAFKTITQPLEQIEEILKNIQITLSNLFGIKRSEIGLSILYSNYFKNFESVNDDHWYWLHVIGTQQDLDKKQLLENENSTARNIIDNKGSYIFYPDKRVGIRENKFIPGPLDSQNSNVGSIYCKDISIVRDNKISVKAVLSVTTYGVQLCGKRDKNTIKKIEKIIMPTFEARLKVELSLLFIKNYLQTKCFDCC